MSRRIKIHYWIVAAIRIQIVSRERTVITQIIDCIRIQEPSPLGIIIPALQIIQPRFGIVVVPAVTEGVIDGIHIDAIAIVPCGCRIAPSIVIVGQNFRAVCIIKSNNIPLEIFLKVEGGKAVGGGTGVPILHSDGRTTFVIQVDQQITVPCLADDLGSVQGVDMLNAIHRLARADAVGVVEEFDHRVGFLHLLELPSVPGEVIPVIGGGIADLVVRNRQAVVREEPPARDKTYQTIRLIPLGVLSDKQSGRGKL